MLKISDIQSFYQLGPRDNQEDYLLPADNDKSTRILVLCDGMGGHGHGEVASKVVADTVYHYLTRLSCTTYTPEMLQQAVDRANAALAQADSYHDARAMGTTLVIVALNDRSVLIGHIGDSRCYVFDAHGNIKFRTTDHSLVAQAVASGIITEEEAFTSPKKNVITRCVMAGQETPHIDVDTIDIANGDSVMLCSDGVSDALRDPELVGVLGHGIESLRQYCEENAKDNNTMLMVQFEPQADNLTAAHAAVAAKAATAATGKVTTKEIPTSLKANLLSARGIIYGVIILLALAAVGWLIVRPATKDTTPATTSVPHSAAPVDSDSIKRLQTIEQPPLPISDPSKKIQKEKTPAEDTDE